MYHFPWSAIVFIIFAGQKSFSSFIISDIKLSGSIESNELGVAYGINNFKMYILALQATRHTYSSEFRATLQFTRFNLDPLTGGDECGVNGDYVELFNTSSLEVSSQFFSFF